MSDRFCIKCNQYLPLEQFHKNKQVKDGYYRFCKECRAKSRKGETIDPELQRLRNLRYRHNHPEKARETSRRGYYNRRDNPEFKEKARKRASNHYHGKTIEERHRMRRAIRERDPIAEKRKRLNRHLQTAYGITLEQYEAMVERQNNGCAICGEPQVNGYLRLYVDHSHESNKVRDLLCHRCNMLVGHLEKNADLIPKAYAYLARHA